MKTTLDPQSSNAREGQMLPFVAWIVLGLIWLSSSPDLAAAAHHYSTTTECHGQYRRHGDQHSDSQFLWRHPPLPVVLQRGGGARATNSTLVLTNIQLSQAGPYYVIVSDNAGSTQSATATVRVDPTFTKITSGPVVEDIEPSVSGAWGDYDDDGRLDLFVANSAMGHRRTPELALSEPRR